MWPATSTTGDAAHRPLGLPPAYEGSKDLTGPDRFTLLLANPERKTTAELYAVAEHVQAVLAQWQDEWMELEEDIFIASGRTIKNPRDKLDPVAVEDQKEAVLYGFKYDPHPSKRGRQDPLKQKLRPPKGRLPPRSLGKESKASSEPASVDGDGDDDTGRDPAAAAAAAAAAGHGSPAKRRRLQGDRPTTGAGAGPGDSTGLRRSTRVGATKPSPSPATTPSTTGSIPTLPKSRARPPKSLVQQVTQQRALATSTDLSPVEIALGATSPQARDSEGEGEQTPIDDRAA